MVVQGINNQPLGADFKEEIDMVVARLVYKNKTGWKTQKNAFCKADSVEKLYEFAQKQAKGREFQVQVCDECNARRFESMAMAI